MFGNKPTVISNDLQKEIISKHLRYADELVRAKNYDAAIAEIKKALQMDPKHSLARSFQQRILLIQKQNMSPEDLAAKGPSQEEINQLITQMFSVAEQMIGKRMYQDALKKIAEVYSLDPGNHFAKAYSDRIEQLIMEQEQIGRQVFKEAIAQKKPEPTTADTPIDMERGSLMMYDEMMKEVWFDGKVTPEEEQELQTVREIFHITMEEHAAIERKVKLKAYIDALKFAWKDGVITDMERQVLDMMRRRYAITEQEHASLELAIQEAKKGTQPKARILIVEPDKNQLVNMMRALQARNFDVVIASRAEDALQVMIKQHPKLIISEAVFPNSTMDGFGFYQKVQEHPALKGTPFFFVSDAKSPKVFHAALRLGFDTCMTKPVDMEHLIAAIDGRLLLR